MITGESIYEVLKALVPLYVAMILAYGSVRWWKVFTPDQCSGINRFVAVFAVPFLSFHFISSNNPYTMNYRFIAADSLQKVVILIALFLWQSISKRGSLDWSITLFSLSTLPNTLVVGIPLLGAMYGDFSASLMVQIVVLQSVIWYTMLLFLFEYRGGKALILEQFPPDVVGSIASLHVESDVVSLNSRDLLQADAELRTDGKLHVIVRRSSSSTSISIMHHRLNSRVSDLTEMEIYSLASSREETPKAPSIKEADFSPMISSKVMGPRTERNSSLNEDKKTRIGKMKEYSGRRNAIMNEGLEYSSISSYPNPNLISSSLVTHLKKGADAKELHMFAWSSSSSPVANRNPWDTVRYSSIDLGADSSSALQHETRALRGVRTSHNSARPMGKAAANGNLDVEHGCRGLNQKLSAVDPLTLVPNRAIDMQGDVQEEGKSSMPRAGVMTRFILIMVWRKLVRNPNTYASIIGLIWSLISFRWNFEMPKIIEGSISILSNTGLGMAMFSLGLFTALQPKIIACGRSAAVLSMAVRFLVGPAVMAAISAAIGFRGSLLQVSIVQAALPQGIVPFVFAKEYDCHADILSTAVIFGLVVALPVTIIYYILLGLGA